MTVAPPVDVQLPDGKPPDWVNSLMRWALTTPGLQGLIGQGVALLSFTGRKTGRLYTIPVSYQRDGELITIVTKKQRKWWHNFESPRDVGLRLGGSRYDGKAQVETDEAAILDFMAEYLRKRPIDAKAYGLSKDELTTGRIAQIVPHLVLIRIFLTQSE